MSGEVSGPERPRRQIQRTRPARKRIALIATHENTDSKAQKLCKMSSGWRSLSHLWQLVKVLEIPQVVWVRIQEVVRCFEILHASA